MRSIASSIISFDVFRSHDRQRWCRRVAMGEERLLKLLSTPSSIYRYQVVCSDGLPDVELTLFADDQMKALSPSSVPLYLREIISFIN